MLETQKNRKSASFSFCKLRVFLLTLMNFLLYVTACDMSSDGQQLDPTDLENPDEKLNSEHLVIWWEEDYPYKLLAADALEKRYPKTKFEFKTFFPPAFTSEYSLPNLSEMMKNDPSPDLIVFDTRYLPFLIESNYLAPIPDAYGLEMDYDTVAELRAAASDALLYVLPFGRIAEGLYYNKEIFDERQVPYPTDGMTWSEVMDLAMEIRRGEEIPITVTAFDSMLTQSAPDLYDPERQSFDFNSTGWQEFIRIMLIMNDFEYNRAKLGGYRLTEFSLGKMAMAAGPLYGNKSLRPGLLHYVPYSRLYDMDWDVVSFPVFDDDRRLNPARQILGIGVAAGSEHKEDAFKVFRYLLSYEVQAENSRNGVISLRADADAFQEEFGSNTVLAGKRVSSFFADGPASKWGQLFELSHVVVRSLDSLVFSDDYHRDVIVDLKEEDLRKQMPILIGARQRYVEDIQLKMKMEQ